MQTKRRFKSSITNSLSRKNQRLHLKVKLSISLKALSVQPLSNLRYSLILSPNYPRKNLRQKRSIRLLRMVSKVRIFMIDSMEFNQQ